MPELPEVETVVRGLAPRLPGHTIEGTAVLRPDILDGSTPTRFARLVKGKTVLSVTRRAKNIVIRTDAQITVVVNLGMTGKLLFFEPGRNIRTSHLAVRWKLSRGARMAYDDVRRFGRVWAGPNSAWETRASMMGPEPLDAAFTGSALHRALLGSRAPMRSWLLDQRHIAGIGNIYANEALYLAGIRPTRPAKLVTESEAHALHSGLTSVLTRAIQSGGTTLRDYRNADGERGEYATALKAYGRDGLPCPACGDPIERQVFGGRSAFFCPTCQS